MLENCQSCLIIWRLHWRILKLAFEKERDAILFSIFLIFRWSSESVCGMVLWWKPQVCPGSPLAQGIFNLARNLKTVYELSGHISRHFWDQQRSPIQGWFSGTFDSIFDGLVFCFLFFFFWDEKKFFRRLVLAVRVPCTAVWLPPPSPAPSCLLISSWVYDCLLSFSTQQPRNSSST